MRILMILHDLPSPYSGSSLPVFNLLKHISQKHDITLLSFKHVTEESRYNCELNQYCEVIEPQSIFVSKSSLKRILHTSANTLSPRNLFSTNPSFFNFYYSPTMQLRIRHLLTTRKFDLIYTNMPMAHYVQNVDLPKVIHEFDCLTEGMRHKYLSMKNQAAKFVWWLEYLRIKRYERTMSNKFDVRIVVSPQEQMMVQSLFPFAKVFVIPNGVDGEFFKSGHEQEQYPSLVFVGDMSYQPNVDAMLYFCFRIYKKVKINMPQVKLFIVGRNPTKEIKNLSFDKSIVITGYVEDVRPYIARSSVVLAPFITGTTGVKNKVLEAMAMAKTVISTSMGIAGITATPGKHVIVADNPDEFADHVIGLLLNKALRQKIGQDARELVEISYSWEVMAKRLDNVFTQAILNRTILNNVTTMGIIDQDSQ